MKLQHILEQGGQDQLQHYAQLIVRDCQPVLQEVGLIDGYEIYRGMDMKEEFVERVIRTDRQPRDTDQDIHQLIDQWFHEKMGVNFRSNAIAVTGDLSIAREYGNTYMIFPKGQFSFMWSPDLQDFAYDLIDELTLYVKQVKQELGTSIIQNLTREQLHQAIYNVMNEQKLKTNNLVKAMESGHEIMIHAHSYYAIRVDDEGQTYRPTQVRQMIKQIQENNQ